MDQNFYISLCIFCGMAFNIDPFSWRNFTKPGQMAFGYKMIQNSPSSLIVSDPLNQVSEALRGQIYSCHVTPDSQLVSNPCSSLDIKVPSEALNMSLGLSMIQDSHSSKLMICGPTIPKKCKAVTTYNGMCFISENNMSITSFKQPIPSSLRDCPGLIDIAFLMDGSGSVGNANFNMMKTFVANMIRRFIGWDAQFAIAQYSSDCFIHYNFNQLKTQNSTWESNVYDIQYQYGHSTYTAKAIKLLVNKLFTQTGGARSSATKILVVITDGQSHDKTELSNAASQAWAKNITCIAIGVGNAFDNSDARQELNTIATDPDTDHVFRVTDFNALNNILQKLEENIIAMEGTQTSGDSSRKEFAQDGFGTAFTSYGSVLLSAVGAFQWKGGYEEFFPNNNYSSYFQEGSEHDSYLGFSVAIAVVSGTNYAILGAPRYQHKGQAVVWIMKSTQDKLILDSPEPQIGSYFGAEVCVVDTNADSNTDLLLISAPTYTEAEREGKVFVYFYSHRTYFNFRDTVLVGMAGQRGRFGSSLASPADLNGDGFSDVVIGAPLEDDGQGSIYIFNGKDGGLISTYSQRISGSSVQSDLKLFGISLSQSSLDQTQDKLPDIAVGSMGAVLLLRSRPIMLLETRVTYSPSKIPTNHTDCSKQLSNNMTVCFNMSGYKHDITGLAANITYRITLDAKRQKYRAYFLDKKRILHDEMTIELLQICKDHPFFIEDCSEDVLNPLSNQLIFTFEGLPSSSIQGLKPVLQPEIKKTTDHNLDFEITCGNDNNCVDDLRMDFNFTGSANIEVGIMQDINVTVLVENRGENSYNTLFTLKYPSGLSYRRVISKQSRVECVSYDGEQGVFSGETTCQVSKPILKGNAQAVFEITYSIYKESTFGQNVRFSAEVKSGNDRHSENSELFKDKTIGVKYAIYLALIRHENSSIHSNFTAGKRNFIKPIKHILKVENYLRELNFSVFISVPIKLGDIDIWTNSDQFQILGCMRKAGGQPAITSFKEVLKTQRVVNCSVAVCAVFTCEVNLMRNEKILYNITGNLSSGWIEQTGIKADVFQLVSTASLDYDKSRYVFYSTDSRHNAPAVQIFTEVEVFEEADLTKEIIGGVMGGLLLLSLITVVLYKVCTVYHHLKTAGFFKSHYKQMLEEATGAAEGQTAQ